MISPWFSLRLFFAEEYLTEFSYLLEDNLTNSFPNELINDYDLQYFTFSLNPLGYFSDV